MYFITHAETWYDYYLYRPWCILMRHWIVKTLYKLIHINIYIFLKRTILYGDSVDSVLLLSKVLFTHDVPFQKALINPHHGHRIVNVENSSSVMRLGS